MLNVGLCGLGLMYRVACIRGNISGDEMGTGLDESSASAAAAAATTDERKKERKKAGRMLILHTADDAKTTCVCVCSISLSLRPRSLATQSTSFYGELNLRARPSASKHLLGLPCAVAATLSLASHPRTRP